ncbi:unnamed protein product, partial [Mesorhabditis belari]|uniref:Phospholipid scramblase n=1 Tax=Mesorhabditis belari TaxID=2138241 RepID=A0AAF3FJI9_9BILA
MNASNTFLSSNPLKTFNLAMPSYVNQPHHQPPPNPQPPPYPYGEQSYQQLPSTPYPDLGSSHSSQSQPVPRPYNQPQHNFPPHAPGMVQWLQETNYESPVVGIPQGLEYLTLINQIIVEQKLDYLEMCTSWRSKHQYIICNQIGQSNQMDVLVNAWARSGDILFTFSIISAGSFSEVMTIRRPFKCCGTFCSSYKTIIEAPPGRAIGYIQQKFAFFKKEFILHSMNNEPQLKIKGPNECSLDFCCPCGDKIFKVETWRKGEIRKQYMDLGVELFTDAKTFTVNFPMELDVFAKAFYYYRSFEFFLGFPLL